MRCNVCDKILSESEVVFNKELGKWEICGTCLDIALEAAFSGDFKQDDGELTYLPPDVETLDPDVNVSYYDTTDTRYRISTTESD